MTGSLTIPRVGTLTCKVGTAAYQYSPVNANLASPGFLNSSAPNSAGGNNCGAYGLRFLYFNVFPFDNSIVTEGNRLLKQFSGGTISGFGVWEYSALLSNPTEYGDWNGSASDYLYADTAGALQFDTGQYQQGGVDFLTYTCPFPTSAVLNLKGAIPLPVQNYNTYSGGTTVNYYGGFPLGTALRCRRPQDYGDTPYNNGYYTDTTTTECLAATTSLSGGVGAEAGSLLNPQGKLLYWDSTQEALIGVLSAYQVWNAPLGNPGMSYTTPSGTGGQVISFSDPTDDELISGGGISSPVSSCLIVNGHFMLHSLDGGNVYYIILSDFTGYYKVIFNGDTSACQAAIEQSGIEPNTAGGYGQDVTGDFWFQAPSTIGGFPVLYSSLTYKYDKIFTGLMPNGLPFLNFSATNCRRLVSQFSNLFEG